MKIKSMTAMITFIALILLAGLGYIFYPRPSETIGISDDGSDFTFKTCSCLGIEKENTKTGVVKTCFGFPNKCKVEVRKPTEADLEKFTKTIKTTVLEK